MEFDPSVMDGTTVGLGAALIWQLARLVHRVQAFLDQLTKHHKAVEGKLDALTDAVKASAGIPSQVERQPTPISNVEANR